jgi:hypothetical protein
MTDEPTDRTIAIVVCFPDGDVLDGANRLTLKATDVQAVMVCTPMDDKIRIETYHDPDVASQDIADLLTSAAKEFRRQPGRRIIQ